MPNIEKPICYLKYDGPGLKDGAVPAAKFGNALIGLDKTLQKLTRRDTKLKDIKVTLQLIETKKKCLDALFTIAQIALIAEVFGVREFTKKFFGELGTQLALKIFSRNEKLTKIDGPPTIKDGIMVSNVINTNGEKKEVNAESLQIFNTHVLDKDLRLITDVLDPQKINLLKYGYKYNEIAKETSVHGNEKDYFSTDEPILDFEEDFDESIAEDIPPMIGKLVAYQALATKYPFKFQPREKQDTYGKRFIPCMIVDEKKRDDYIELMKSYIGNVIIQGRGIKDEKGSYNKIKIISVVKHENPKLL